ncbi:MAG: DJ-1/PfpI family protein, partial [Opitutales bacterium]
GLPDVHIEGRNGLRLLAEVPFAEVSGKHFDLVVVPGGPAAKVLRKDLALRALLQRQEAEGRLIGAICAAPTVLADAGLLEDRAYTAHFSVAEELTRLDRGAPVVEDRQIITSQGAGTATEFGLRLVARLVGEEDAREVATAICWQH